MVFALHRGHRPLTKAFVLAGAGFAGGLAGCSDLVGPTTDPIPLAEGEIALAGDIFNGEMNPHIVSKYREPPRKGAAAGVNDGMTFLIYGDMYYSNDYSKEEDAFLFGLFAHEMTHIWQFQTGYYDDHGDCNIYDFTLSEKSRLSDFCNEQQATIVENYARRFLKFNPAPSSYRYKGRPGDVDTPETDALLIRVVEDRFPWAAAARLEMEEQRKTAGPAAGVWLPRFPLIIPPDLRY